MTCFVTIPEFVYKFLWSYIITKKKSKDLRVGEKLFLAIFVHIAIGHMAIFLIRLRKVVENTISSAK